MIKFIFITSIIFTVSLVQADCQNKIDPNKVNLFIDTNQSEPEIKAAQEAACLRGEAFEVIPRNYKEYTPLIKKAEELRVAYKKCVDLNQPAKQKSTDDPCQAQNNNYQKGLNELKDFEIKQGELSDQFEKRLNELKTNQMKITSMSVSGHDGGGHFGGEKGELSRSEIAEIIGRYPEVNEVQSLLLLGCYTGVTKEVKKWRSIFPKLKLIGGYDGQAPLSNIPRGHDYIKDILLNEDKMLTLKNDKTLDADLKRMLSGIENLNAAVWVDPICSEEQKGFYYASKNKRKFQKLEPDACDEAVNQITLISKDFEKYDSGELEPPIETGPGTPLRRIYEKVRSNEHCLEYIWDNTDLSITDSAAFNLLFWHGIKQNFAEYYDEDMKKAQEIINNIDVEKIIKKTEEKIEEIQAKKLEAQKLLDEYKIDPEKVSAKLKSEYNELDAKISGFMLSAQGQNILSKSESQMTPEELELFINYNKDLAKQNSLMIRNGDYLASLTSRVEFQNQRANEYQSKLSSLKNSANSLKKPFAPTKSVIQSKTRKELLENVHNAYKFSDLHGLNPKEEAALRFISEHSDTHFRFHENPFSWHEYTGDKPEAPSYASEKTLDSFIEKYSSRIYMEQYY